MVLNDIYRPAYSSQHHNLTFIFSLYTLTVCCQKF